MTRPTNDEIDERVDDWCRDEERAPGEGRWPMPLHIALGWTRDEYSAWVKDFRNVPDRALPKTAEEALGMVGDAELEKECPPIAGRY